MTDGTQRVVWLASYPKSGNTWLRFFLHALLYGAPENSAAVDRRFPEAARNLTPAQLVSGRNYFKTHWVCDPAAIPCWGLTERAIYMVRNPLQIVVSGWHYLILRSGKEYAAASEDERQEMFLKYASQFVQTGGSLEWKNFGVGSWAENVESWTSAPVPVLLLRYEDFLADPTTAGASVVEFLDIDADAESISAAIEASSFEAMRRLEEQEIADATAGYFTYDEYAAGHAIGGRVVRAARTDEFESLFTRDQLEKLRTAFGEQFRRMGYG